MNDSQLEFFRGVKRSRGRRLSTSVVDCANFGYCHLFFRQSQMAKITSQVGSDCGVTEEEEDLVECE
jgi:hypothetical protein